MLKLNSNTPKKTRKQERLEAMLKEYSDLFHLIAKEMDENENYFQSYKHMSKLRIADKLETRIITLQHRVRLPKVRNK